MANVRFEFLGLLHFVVNTNSNAENRVGIVCPIWAGHKPTLKRKSTEYDLRGYRVFISFERKDTAERLFNWQEEDPNYVIGVIPAREIMGINPPQSSRILSGDPPNGRVDCQVFLTEGVFKVNSDKYVLWNLPASALTGPGSRKVAEVFYAEINGVDKCTIRFVKLPGHPKLAEMSPIVIDKDETLELEHACPQDGDRKGPVKYEDKDFEAHYHVLDPATLASIHAKLASKPLPVPVTEVEKGNVLYLSTNGCNCLGCAGLMREF